MSTEQRTSDTTLLLGVITGAHGLRGEVKIKSFTNIPADIARYGALQDKSGERLFTLQVTGEAKGLVLAKVNEVRDRNAAERLRGVELYVDASRLPPPEDGEYFVEDLIGMQVRDSHGAPVGDVTAMHDYGAGDLVEITFPDGRNELFAFCDANFPEVNLEERYLVFSPPEILAAGNQP